MRVVFREKTIFDEIKAAVDSAGDQEKVISHLEFSGHEWAHLLDILMQGRNMLLPEDEDGRKFTSVYGVRCYEGQGDVIGTGESIVDKAQNNHESQDEEDKVLKGLSPHLIPDLLALRRKFELRYRIYEVAGHYNGRVKAAKRAWLDLSKLLRKHGVENDA